MLPVDDLASPVFPYNEVENCGSCHEEGLKSYLASVHGHGLQASGLLSYRGLLELPWRPWDLSGQR